MAAQSGAHSRYPVDRPTFFQLRVGVTRLVEMVVMVTEGELSHNIHSQDFGRLDAKIQSTRTVGLNLKLSRYEANISLFLSHMVLGFNLIAWNLGRVCVLTQQLR